MLNIDVDCPNSQRVLPGCTFCIFELPCQCSISTESMVFTSRLINCQKESKNVSILYLVNFALLQEFFNNPKLIKILVTQLLENQSSQWSLIKKFTIIHFHAY
mgnify:CR=1 FL=1